MWSRTSQFKKSAPQWSDIDRTSDEGLAAAEIQDFGRKPDKPLSFRAQTGLSKIQKLSHVDQLLKVWFQIKKRGMQRFSVSRFMELSLSSHQAQIRGLMMDGILWAAAECVIWVDLLRAGEVLSSSETTLPQDEFLEAPDSQRQEDVEWRMEGKWRAGGKIRVKRRKSCHESCTERGKKLFSGVYWPHDLRLKPPEELMWMICGLSVDLSSLWRKNEQFWSAVKSKLAVSP